MKAVRFIGPGKLEYGEVPTPEISDTEVLVRIKAVGICATDLELLSGDMPYIKKGITKYPLIPGHEWSGQIEKVGKNVPDEFKPGDRITGDVSIGCGSCFMCKTGRFNLCPNRVVVGSYRNKDGAFAEYIKMPYRHIYKIPDSISYEEAALIEPSATAAYGVIRSKIGYGDSVLVIGDGPIGQMVVQCAKASGASKVYAVGSWDEKLKVALQNGADAALNYKRDDVAGKAMELTGGAGVDVVVESSGNTAAFNQAVRSVRPGGKLVLLSIYGKTDFPAEIDNIITKDADVICVLASCNSFKPTIAMMESGRLNVKPLITHRFPLEKAGEALQMIKDKKECRIKVLLIP